jgi:DNA-binding transcriptional ArsR family regulator
MLDIEVIEDPAAAEASLDPIRTRILQELAEPGSATQLAAKVGLPRQKVNYHLKALERHGLVELVEERRKGNVTERVLRATAASYLISPAPWRRWRRTRGVSRTASRPSGCWRWPAAWSRRWASSSPVLPPPRRNWPASRSTARSPSALPPTCSLRRRARRGGDRLVDKYHDGGAAAAAGGARKHRLVVVLHPALKPETHNDTTLGSNQQKRSRTMTDNRKFEIVADTELPGTPERVWEAVTKGTPAGCSPRTSGRT